MTTTWDDTDTTQRFPVQRDDDTQPIPAVPARPAVTADDMDAAVERFTADTPGCVIARDVIRQARHGLRPVTAEQVQHVLMIGYLAGVQQGIADVIHATAPPADIPPATGRRRVRARRAIARRIR